MGSGASSNVQPARTELAAATEQDLASALKDLSPEALTKLKAAVEEAEAAPKAPTFDKPPMKVPGISKEEEAPKRQAVSKAQPSGRPRSAEMKKKTETQTPKEAEKTTDKASAAESIEKDKVQGNDSKTAAVSKSEETPEKQEADVGKEEVAKKVVEEKTTTSECNKTDEKEKTAPDPAVATRVEDKTTTSECNTTDEKEKTSSDPAVATKVEEKKDEVAAMTEHTEAVTEK